MYKPIQLKTKASLVRNSNNRSPLWNGLFLVPLLLALWAMPGTTFGQVLSGNLFASLNGPTCGLGCASIYEYTPQYIYIPGEPPTGSLPSSVVASTLYSPRGLVFDNAGNLFVASTIAPVIIIREQFSKSLPAA